MATLGEQVKHQNPTNSSLVGRVSMAWFSSSSLIYLCHIEEGTIGILSVRPMAFTGHTNICWVIWLLPLADATITQSGKLAGWGLPHKNGKHPFWELYIICIIQYTTVPYHNNIPSSLHPWNHRTTLQKQIQRPCTPKQQQKNTDINYSTKTSGKI